MGRLSVVNMLEHNSNKEQTLKWHLTANHFPPVSLAFLPVVKQAIKEAKNENWNKVLKMPNGLERSVSFIIEGLHLESFIEL